MSTTPSHTAKHPRLVLFLIILVVVGPMLFAWMLVKRADVHQFKQSSHGDLIPHSPNIDSVTFYNLSKKENSSGKALLGKWWIVYVGPEKCYQECQGILYDLRQIHVALGKNTSRVERLFVPNPKCPTALCDDFLIENYPDLIRAKFEPIDFHKLFSTTTPSVDNEMLGEIYIIDPLGNIMMHYSPDVDPKGILSDLKRLLRVSKIG